jgi:hypothetical protein
MLTQLTLDLDETLVQRAESYAQRTGKSLSQVVADYFARLECEEARSNLPPVTRSLLGCMASGGVDEGDYLAHIEEKFR